MDDDGFRYVARQTRYGNASRRQFRRQIAHLGTRSRTLNGPLAPRHFSGQQMIDHGFLRGRHRRT
jgi:hypothetical protein